MSYVEIFRIAENGDVLSFGEAKNNHGGAPLIWDDLAKRHRFTNDDHAISNTNVLHALWDSVGTGKLERWEEVLLGCTFDFVWVPRDLVEESATAFIRFHQRAAVDKLNLVETCMEIATVLLDILRTDPTALGAAFNMCSACSPFWYVRDDGDEDNRRPYNILTDREQPSGEYAGSVAQSLADILQPFTKDTNEAPE